MNKTIEAMHEALLRAKHIRILPHKHPDGDTLGSSFACFEVLKALGKEVDIDIEGDIPDNLCFYFKKEDLIDTPVDLYLVVDSSSKDRVEGRLQDGIFTIVIDHHLTNLAFGDLNFVDAEASSTCEVLYEIFSELKIELNERARTSLYIGLTTDTNRLFYESARLEAFKMAYELKASGVDTAWIHKKLYSERKLEKMRLEAYAIEHATRRGEMIFALLDEEAQKKLGSNDTDDIVELLRDLEGIEVSVLFYDKEGKRKASLRSKNYVDVSQIATTFNGGGHKRAAGISDMKGQEEHILKAIENVLHVRSC
ncbi:DHH family phosphoesterase [Guggenheimella bovis]